MKVYIGYDDREAEASEVAARTLRKVTHGQIESEFLCAPRLSDHGLLNRMSDHRGGQDYDLVSNAHKATRFAISRFLTVLLCQNGFALFVDADVVFQDDPRYMLDEISADKAVHVVKHDHRPAESWKMVDQVQTAYPRKNWSSVMLFDCDHHANRRLSLRDINHRPGRDLHAFYWLHDDEIGSLDPRWNWLVNVEDRPSRSGIAHFTLGGPWIPGWNPAPHDDIWLDARKGL